MIVDSIFEIRLKKELVFDPELRVLEENQKFKIYRIFGIAIFERIVDIEKVPKNKCLWISKFDSANTLIA